MPPKRAVLLRCTDCSLKRTYDSNDEIPEQFREGCPRCGATVAVSYADGRQSP